MRLKYNVNPNAYKNSLRRLEKRPDLKERYDFYEKKIAEKPAFDTEEKAVAYAIGKIKAGEYWKIFLAPKERGGKWHTVPTNGIWPEAADQLGMSMIYDEEILLVMAENDIDNIEEV